MEDFLHKTGSMSKVYGCLEKIFPGRPLDNMMRLTTLMHYEIVAQHLVKHNTSEETRALATSAGSTSALSTSNVVPRRFFNDPRRALLKDIFKVGINNGRVSKVTVWSLLKMRPTLVEALAPVDRVSVLLCFAVDNSVGMQFM